MDVLLRGYVLGEVGGLVPKSLAAIETMPVAEMGPALEAGRFDAAFMWEPFVARMLARRTARVVLNVNRVEPYYPWYVIAARREFVDAHPERVKSVLRAHRMAITHLNSSPNAGNSVIARAFELTEEDRARRQGVLARGDRQARPVAARMGVGPERGRPGLHRTADGLEHFARVHQGAARRRFAARSRPVAPCAARTTVTATTTATTHEPARMWRETGGGRAARDRT